ncbi:MAG: hypothetical protein QHH07_11100, partial [Sedimentisphaerales bacterium]|nr:hypothetical protein [Sedimentisphaerales bacterium]
LSNAGEQIRLQDPTGKVILEFTYDDDWYPSTDGGGFSLVVDHQPADPNLLSSKAAWRPSTSFNGSPGRQDN